MGLFSEIKIFNFVHFFNKFTNFRISYILLYPTLRQAKLGVLSIKLESTESLMQLFEMEMSSNFNLFFIFTAEM